MDPAIQRNREAITNYFFMAWRDYYLSQNKWLNPIARSALLTSVGVSLYQACSLAGLRALNPVVKSALLTK